MGAGQSKAEPSSLEQGTASIIAPPSSQLIADNGVQLSASTRDATNYDDMPSSYEPPSSPVKPLAHYIFLVHGWLGNDLEMSYLAEAFQNSIAVSSSGGPSDDQPDAKRIRRSASEGQKALDSLGSESSPDKNKSTLSNKTPDIVVHSVKCNVGKTHDGIRKGGTRLANEIRDFIRSDVQKRQILLRQDDSTKSNNSNGDKTQLENDNNTDFNEHNANTNSNNHVTFSIVGNSLGGLYSRYAISLLPYQLQITSQRNPSAAPEVINLHPNIFCTTATPHLGVSKHTYLPIPRFAETIIGSGMGETGRDLFRLNSDANVVGAVGGGIRRLSSYRRNGGGDDNMNGGITNLNGNINNRNGGEGGEDDMECIIRSMCLEGKYLNPLRNFRQRIAYANAYGTDFQVPTETAAFLNGESKVDHYLIASRDVNSLGGGSGEGGDSKGNNGNKEEDGQTSSEECPSFIVAILQTEQKSLPPSPISTSRAPSNELLKMSQSLDALGWQKVFIDVRNRIPVPGVSMPAWFRPASRSSLDDVIQKHASRSSDSDSGHDGAGDANDNSRTTASQSLDPSTKGKCVLTSEELARSTTVGETLHFPLGHTVMVANSKSETYSRLNSQGRPVMDKLAEDMIRDVLLFE